MSGHDWDSEDLTFHLAGGTEVPLALISKRCAEDVVHDSSLPHYHTMTTAISWMPVSEYGWRVRTEPAEGFGDLGELGFSVFLFSWYVAYGFCGSRICSRDESCASKSCILFVEKNLKANNSTGTWSIPYWTGDHSPSHRAFCGIIH